jgi:hypothetical protein
MSIEFRLNASDAVALQDFGIAVAVGGDYAIVGALNSQFGPGAAYVLL